MALKPEHGPLPEPTNGAHQRQRVDDACTAAAAANCQECDMVHAVGTRDTGL